MHFLNLQSVLFFCIPAYLLGLFYVYNKDLVSEQVQAFLPFIFSLVGLVMVLKSFTERKNVQLSWVLIFMSHFWIALAVSFNENFSFHQIHFYLSGVFMAGILGYLCLRRLANVEHRIDLDQFHGHSYKHPKMAVIFLLACLGMSGFPITPTFIGEDLLFIHIHEDQVLLALFTALIFIVTGLSMIRIYARIFLGPHMKSADTMAYRSS